MAALCGELELGEAVDLLQVRPWIGCMIMNVAWKPDRLPTEVRPRILGRAIIRVW